MDFVERFVRRPVLSSMVSLALVLLGVIGYTRLPVREFPDADPPLVYTENAGGGLFLEADADVERYRTSFQRLAAQALSPKDTVQMIRQAAEAA